MTDKTWLVMSAVNPIKSTGVSFTSNAVDLTEAEAKVEAERRNGVERAAGHKGVDWFPCENPMAVMARMGFDMSALKR